CVDLLLGPRDRRPRLQPADILEVVTVSLLVTPLFRRERQRTPEQHIRAEKIEVLRHDADHRDRLAVEAKFLPQRRRVAAELRLPERVADDGSRVAAHLPILFAEGTPQYWAHP